MKKPAEEALRRIADIFDVAIARERAKQELTQRKRSGDE